MLTQLLTVTLYAAVGAGMLFQVATADRAAVRVKRARDARRPATEPRPTRLRLRLPRLRRRDYRLALRAARASTSA